MVALHRDLKNTECFKKLEKQLSVGQYLFSILPVKTKSGYGWQYIKIKSKVLIALNKKILQTSSRIALIGFSLSLGSSDTLQTKVQQRK